MAHKKDGLLQRKRKKKRGERGFFFGREEKCGEGNGNRNGPLKTAFRWWGCGKGKKRGIANVVSTIHYFLSLSLVETLEAESTVWKSAEEISPIFREKKWEYAQRAFQRLWNSSLLLRLIVQGFPGNWRRPSSFLSRDVFEVGASSFPV